MYNTVKTKMSLLKQWRDFAYNEAVQNSKGGQKFWEVYFHMEKGIYEQLLEKPEEAVTGTLEELANKFDIEKVVTDDFKELVEELSQKAKISLKTDLKVLLMVGFADGINDSLKKQNDIDNMELDTKLSLDFDNEKLYYNMVDCNAEWLFTLPQWDDILSTERREELVKEWKNSRTIHNDNRKVGRNDPCPCGSGKKYKQCCGRK